MRYALHKTVRRSITNLLLGVSCLSFVIQPFFATPAMAQSSGPSVESLALVARSSFYTGNDIHTFDKSGTAQANSTCTPGAGGGDVPNGTTNAERAFKFLVGQGLTANQAAGIVGNLMQESGGGTFNIDPAITNPSSGAYGIAQWYAERKTALISFANSNGGSVSDIEVQLNFLWKELNGAYKSTVLDPIKATTDLKGPTLVWLERFEVPCMPGSCQGEMTIRMPMVQKAYDAYHSLAPNSTGSSSAGCGDAAGTQIDASGYAFPVGIPKAQLFNWCKWPIQTSAPYCHHDNTPAIDISIVGNQNNAIGKPVYAIIGGTIQRFNTNYNGSGCQAFQLVGDDGWWYWYGHIRSKLQDGQKVKVGEQLGTIGESICSAPSTTAPPHLHIDRGSPKGHYGGTIEARDPAFLVLINQLYANLK